MENELEKSGFDKRLSDELPEGVKWLLGRI
jgi:hypothetical protein